MSNIIRTMSVTLVMAFAATAANAFSVSLSADNPPIEGGTYIVDIVLGADGGDPGTSGSFFGDLIVGFDSGQLSITNFGPTGSAPDGMAVENSDSISYAYVDGVKNGSIFSIEFAVLASLGATINLSIADNDGFGSLGYSQPTNQLYAADFNGLSSTVAAVPIPATAWLIASGLGFFGFVARRWSA